MKKIMSLVVLVALAACSNYYDYYKGGVRYTQDGDDCIYYADEYANRFSGSISGLDGSNRIVYRNTRCADLFAMDNPMRVERNDRQVLVPAAKPVEAPKCGCGCAAKPEAPKCGCAAAPVARHFYSFTAK